MAKFQIEKYLPSWASRKKEETVVVNKRQVRAFSGDGYRPLFSVSFTGEKNLGEIGPVKDYRPAYEILRLRSWQAYLESEIAQTVINRFVTWVIGKGLKLQSEPVADVLEQEGVDVDTHKFSEVVEARFNIFRQSKRTDYSEMVNLDMIAKTAYINSINGGDVLVVLRYTDGVTIQLIDGAHVVSPQFGTEYFPQQLANGNRIINGIEVDAKGKHVRYYVRGVDPVTFATNPLNYTIFPIEAYGKE